MLVHCNMALSRSPTVVMAYLIYYKGMPFEEAYDFVKGTRFIRPQPEFLEQLKRFEEAIRSNELQT